MERVMGIEPLSTNSLNRKDFTHPGRRENDTSNDTSSYPDHQYLAIGAAPGA
jgi:hypothetical protein